MRMIRRRPLLHRLQRLADDQRGFAMVAVIGIMAVTGLFLAAGFAAADGDLPMVQNSKDRKRAYAAAEAGLAYYRYHLAEDNDYWTHCDNVPGPAAGVPAPITQAGATNRRWRALPSSDARYTVELLPAKGYSACTEGDEKSMLEKSTGTFRIRATGQAGGVTRSIVATFRRASFLDFLYFTDFETMDPAAYPTAPQRAAAALTCANKYRADRVGCQEIQFREPDALNGPVHTNDDLLTCNKPTFGRDENDLVEVSGPAPGFHKVCANVDPTFKGIFKYEQPPLTMPKTNHGLKTVADALSRYTGKTTILLQGDHYKAILQDGSSVTRNIPPSGVIYVDNGPGCTGKEPPVMADYNDPLDCAIVYVTGTYSKNLTIGSAGDIVIRPEAGIGSGNGDIIHTNDAILGLIADEFIRYWHPVQNSVWYGSNRHCDNVTTGPNPYMKTVRIEAALLSLNHSITTDNFNCGDNLDNLTIFGALAQPYRGTVGSTGMDGQSGFIKDYNYDERLRFRSPPYFLTPVDAAWKVMRTNEQVPAAT
jgi:hypothetical protein